MRQGKCEVFMRVCACVHLLTLGACVHERNAILPQLLGVVYKRVCPKEFLDLQAVIRWEDLRVEKTTKKI